MNDNKILYSPDENIIYFHLFIVLYMQPNKVLHYVQILRINF